MNIFESILYPITWLMRTILEAVYGYTQSYGIAIIVMSFVINTILIPAYMLAELLQSQELRVRNRMQHKIDEFNTAFSGMTRFMYMRTLYRIHRYHPIMGLRSLGGLVVQFPFFIAAYQLLGHYELFKQVPFFIVSDLLQPDALFTIGHVPINVLPFVMTAVNLLAADMYTRRTNPKALVHIWGLAFVFLILLYNAPSALVLYWTVNNAYSWLKNVLLLMKHKKKNVQSVPSTFQLLKASYAKFLRNKQRVRIIVIAIELLILYLFAAYFLFNSNRARGTTPLQLLNTTAFLGFVQTVFLFTMFLKHTPKYKLWYMLTKYSVLLGLMICVAVVIYNMYTPVHSIDLPFTIRKIAICFVLILLHAMLFLWLRCYLRVPITSISYVKKPHSSVYRYIVICTVIFIPFLLLIALPTEVYTSDPSAIGKPLEALQGVLFLFTLVVAVLLFLLYLLTPKAYKHYVSAVFYTIAITVFAYTYLLPFDYGAVDNFILVNPRSIVLKTALFIVEGIALISVLLLVIHYISKKQNAFLLCIIGCTIFTLLRFASTEMWYYNSNFQASLSQKTKNTKLSTSDTSKEVYGDIFEFSKDGKNIVVFLLDMFSGGLMKPILASEPELKRIYNGFTWYPNALSISTYTATSKAAMMSGWDYTPENINKMDGVNLAEKFARAYDAMFELYQSHNYAVATSGLSYYVGDGDQCKLIEERDVSCLSRPDISTVGYWIKNNKVQSNKIQNIAVLRQSYLLAAVGFIRAFPFFMKRFIYDDGVWNIFNSRMLKNFWGYKAALEQWSFIDSLVNLSYVGSDKNTFKFFHNDITHMPYGLDSSCTLVKDEFPDPSAGDNMVGKNSYYSARCAMRAIGRWVTWLKENGIYDNTKIIIISDHGFERIEDEMNGNGIALDFFGQTNTKNFSRAHILFMVKDFHSRGMFKTDERLVSNVDLPAVMCDGLENCNGIPKSPLRINPAPVRTLPIYHTTFYGWRDLVSDKKFTIKVHYEVTDSIFKKENWRRVK